MKFRLMAGCHTEANPALDRKLEAGPLESEAEKRSVAEFCKFLSDAAVRDRLSVMTVSQPILEKFQVRVEADGYAYYWDRRTRKYTPQVAKGYTVYKWGRNDAGQWFGEMIDMVEEEEVGRRRSNEPPIIESKLDLAQIFNKGERKFERLDFNTGQESASELREKLRQAEAREVNPDHMESLHSNADATLEQMSVNDLRAHAAAEEIDLGDARSKQQIIAAIRNATAGAHG